MKEYRIQSRTLYWVFVAVVPIFSIAVAGFTIQIVASQPGSGAVMWLAVIWSASMAYACYQMITMPHTIQITDSGILRFVGAFKTRAIAPSEVISVRASGAFVQVKHTKGRITALHQFTGFHEFLVELRQENETVRFRGV